MPAMRRMALEQVQRNLNALSDGRVAQGEALTPAMAIPLNLKSGRTV